jgi:hypothetical protein
LAKALAEMRARRLLGKTERELGLSALVQQGELKTRGAVPSADGAGTVVRYANRSCELRAGLAANGTIAHLMLVLVDPEKAARKRDNVFQVTVVGESGRREPANYATAVTLTFLREALGAPMTQASELYSRLLATPASMAFSGARLGFASTPSWENPDETMHGLSIWLPELAGEEPSSFSLGKVQPS